jgi:hypothetical protein
VLERRQVRRTAAPEVEQYLDSTLDDGLAWLGDPFDVVQLADPLELAARLLDGPVEGPPDKRKRRADQDEIDYLERLFNMD